MLTSNMLKSIILAMRTTLTLDDAVLRQVKEYAESRNLTLGDAVGDLVQRALAAPRGTKEVNGLHVFDLGEESPRVTSKKVRELDAEQG